MGLLPILAQIKETEKLECSVSDYKARPLG
jgi:hypothetical protein